jgi:hypothetical protein
MIGSHAVPRCFPRRGFANAHVRNNAAQQQKTKTLEDAIVINLPS